MPNCGPFALTELVYEFPLNVARGWKYVLVYSSGKDKRLGYFQSAIPHGRSHGPSDLVRSDPCYFHFIQGRVPGSSSSGVLK